jgi:predicted signal transduction protein with EAL and GGDEF domain
VSDGGAPVRRRAAAILFGVVVVVAAGLTLWAIPRTLSFVPHAHQAFWITSLLALIAEAPLFVFPRGRQASNPTTLSVCFTFPILLGAGVGPAIAVQTLAIVIRAFGLRQRPLLAAYLGSRLVLALAVSEAVIYLVDGPKPGSSSQGQAVLGYLLQALIWFIVSYGLVVLAQAALGLGRVSSFNTALREDLLGTAALLLLVPPLLAQLRGWSAALVLLPLLAWNQLARTSAGRQEALRRDAVAGVLNRRGLQDRFDQLVAVDATQVDGSGVTGVALVSSELIYDVRRDLGPEIFEHLAIEAAGRLTAGFKDDRVGLITGEGFVILLPGTTQAASVAVGRDVRALLARPIVVDGVPFVADPVVGVATAPSRGGDFDSLIAQAQQAVTQAREVGQQVGTYVPETSAGLRRRREILTDLNAVLNDPDRFAEITMLYQPQVDVETGRLVGVEALLRWNQPSWGPVPIDEIIDAVEHTQVMPALTAHVISRVAAQLQSWRQTGSGIRASVNVSILDLYDDTFPDQVSRVLQSHSLPSNELTIEITETALVTEPDRVSQAATALRGVGVGLSLDDFGTGYASLQQLRRLPLTEVKIDKSYVDKLAREKAEQAIVTSVHAYARALDLTLVAEGVDSSDTLACLAQLPGIVGQGYHIGRPMVPAELDQWRRDH